MVQLRYVGLGGLDYVYYTTTDAMRDDLLGFHEQISLMRYEEICQ